MRRLSGWMLCVLPLLCGCATLQVKMGWKVSLAKTPVASMAPSLVGAQGLAPGSKAKLMVTFQTTDGKTLTTEGAGHGKVMWSDLALKADVVSVTRKGKISLSGDPRVSDKKTGSVAFTIPSQPALHAELTVPVRYDYPFHADYAGASGMSGTRGMDGTNGSSGSSGSSDPNNPSPGGNGSDGTSGGDGGNGDDGGDGPDVQVMVRWRSKSHLLQASVTPSGGKTRYFLIDPNNGGSLEVHSDGGAGGAGGKGGSGGSGGAGGSGWPPGMSGNNGSDGRDGMAGSDGRPGHVTVTYDSSAAPYMSAVKVPASATMLQGEVGKMW